MSVNSRQKMLLVWAMVLGVSLIGSVGCNDNEQPRDHRTDKECSDCPIKE
jgi:hypothetical protein